MPVPLYLCLHTQDFAAQTVARLRPELRERPLAILAGDPPGEIVFALNSEARRIGLATGMSRLQAESFESTFVMQRVKPDEDSSFLILLKSAEQFSPRIEVLACPAEKTSGATLILDVSSSDRLFGSAEQIASTLRRGAEHAGFESNTATSHNSYVAVLAARGFQGTTVIAHGKELATLSSLPLAVLQLEPEQEETFRTWGIRTLGALASLPPKALIARLGQAGYRVQALARGEYQHLLTPTKPPVDAMLIESQELEHPVDLLEPLLFLLSRMLEQILRRAAEHALAIASVETRLALDGIPGKEHRRIIRPAFPECNHHTLLKLVQLDLEMHPPQASVIALYMQAQPSRPQTVQEGLFVPQTPEAGQLEVLLARLRKLLGEDHVGAPELLDSHRPDAFRIAPFLPATSGCPPAPSSGTAAPALRMLRPPRPVQIEIQHSRMTAISLDGRKLPIRKASGPWKTSGAWWTHSDWCREEWDMALGEQEKIRCRVAYDPGTRCWYLTGVYD
jgi:protein ImuB